MARVLSSVSRRDVLVGAASTGIALLGANVLGTVAKGATPSDAFRFAHLTDLHIKGKRCAHEVQCAIDHALDRQDKPKLILTGGDLVYDSMTAEEKFVRHQWNDVKRAFSHHRLPVEHILGNHDIWGIDRDKSKTTGKESLYGKRFAMDALEMTTTFRSFDKGGWHFVLLDDVAPLPEQKTYEGRIDEAQFEWLAADLKSVGSDVPVIVLTHIPILGASVFFPPQTTQNATIWNLPYSMMHGDAHRIVTLFEQHPNVKLCLSGHTHLVDKVEYKGVTYMGNGAVCGNWWNGSFQGFAPGYSLIDLYRNGSFKSQYEHYQEVA